MKAISVAMIVVLVWMPAALASVEAMPDYQNDVVPVFTRYCAGCHNDDDREGGLSVTSIKEMLRGGENGPALVPGQADRSRLIQVLIGEAKPAMPPEDEEQPTADDISVLRHWIDAGAKVSVTPRGDSVDPSVDSRFPQLRPSLTAKPITSVAYSPDGNLLAVARFREVELLTADDQRFIQRFDQHPGKVNDVRFSQDGRYLFVATGIVGVSGEVVIWDLSSGQVHARLSDHQDALYAAVPSRDGKLLATAGYDRQIKIWELSTLRPRHILNGHNGPIYDLAFGRDSRILASASADATVKVWDVETGQRLDTLSQPLKEQHTVDISPDGQYIIAGGEDNRIRMWRLVSVDRPRINPLLIARFGHEQTVERLRYTANGDRVISVAADGKLKVWDATRLRQLQTVDLGDDVAQALAVCPVGDRVALGQMDGRLMIEKIAVVGSRPSNAAQRVAVTTDDDQPMDDESVQQFAEQEPNDSPSHAVAIAVPAHINGTIFRADGEADADYFRFDAKRGERLVFETRAARDQSPLDSKISVRSNDDQLIPRVLLRAVRDSYFTFRGKDSSQTGDFRLHNWREMQLNQLLYASGEVVKLYHYPRGPDSGFNVYPNFGSRHTFFDTTSVTHALHEPCYIVQPQAPGDIVSPNGLPTFLINYENDDESQRRYGNDSYLTFQAPDDGQYVVRVEDVRGFQGEDFKYELQVRHPRPDFQVTVHGRDPSVPKGAGRKFEVRIVRLDGFDGEVRIDIDNLPPGIKATSPLTVESGHLQAWGTLTAALDLEAISPDVATQSIVTASAIINGRRVEKQVGSLGQIKLEETPKLLVDFSKDGSGTATRPVIEIRAGTTTTALIRIERRGHTGRVGFGSEAAVFNSPHGVYVDNIGLNGVLITEAQNERTIFITAEPWVEASERLVFVEAGEGGRPTSQPVLMRVLPEDTKLSSVQ